MRDFFLVESKLQKSIYVCVCVCVVSERKQGGEEEWAGV